MTNLDGGRLLRKARVAFSVVAYNFDVELRESAWWHASEEQLLTISSPPLRTERGQLRASAVRRYLPSLEKSASCNEERSLRLSGSRA